MFKVFSGEWRGLGNEDKGLFLMMDFRFRDVLHLFQHAKLGVFLCLVLHSDKEGWSFPSYDLIKKETGYNSSTIGLALRDLCELSINGQRVLLRFRERDEAGHYSGSNRYLIFPTAEEVLKYEKSPKSKEEKPPMQNEGVVDPPVQNPDLDNPDVENPDLEKPDLENQGISINHSLRNNQSLREINTTGEKPSPVGGGTRAKKQGDLVDGMLAFANKTGAPDFSFYPEEVRGYLVEIYQLWKIAPPPKSNRQAVALWIKETRGVISACGEFGYSLLHRYYRKWKEGDPAKRLTISRPGSLINMLGAEAGLARQEREDTKKPIGVHAYDPAFVADFQEKLRIIRQQTANVSR